MEEEGGEEGQEDDELERRISSMPLASLSLPVPNKTHKAQPPCTLAVGMVVEDEEEEEKEEKEAG